jgi:GDPmannose 4,6-dehydratase
MPTALITGILGQDGSLLAELLVERGYAVVGVVRPGAIVSESLREAMARCRLVELDLSRLTGAAWAVDLVASVAPDEVYHLAACHRSSDRALVDDLAQQQQMVDVNLAVGLALAHGILARGRGSLVVAGSSQMYTAALPALRVDEATPIQPSTFYGVTKSCCLQAIRWLRDKQGLRGSCAILFNHESPRRSASFVSRKITRAAARIAAGLETSLELADLSSRADFSSSRDVVEGLHLMATAAQPDDRVLASGTLHSVEDLCRAAFEAVGIDWREHVRSAVPAGERPALVGDPVRMERELGWERRHGFSQWIEEMVNADRRALEGG